ncbi:MAG TPA: HDIG domain-containing protein [Candidatus Bilophila faecipullorum]|uniref:HDIG domain-containing protein n=8 Tax=Bilophila TaxID=35832 RepID=A0A9D1U9L3_9BACT|nr:HDIG domain-containing protein [Candidatus Bilophila faecipullorum]
MTTRNSPLRITELSRLTRSLFRQHHHGVGLLVLIATLFALSFLAGLQPPVQFRVFMAGEVADSDVVAHRSLTVEDTEAARARRHQVAMLQPTVFDLSVTEIAALREQIFSMLKKINGQDPAVATPAALRASLAETLGTQVNSDLLAQWSLPAVQEYILSTALPWFESQLRLGVVGSVRLALPSKNGIIIRDMDNKTETLRPEVGDIRDVPAVLAAFTQKLRTASALTPEGRRAVLIMFSPLIMPTLTLNREATQALGDAVAQTVEPVYYHIQKGEVVVYQGERVTREKQLKLQSLYQKQDGLIHARTVAGTFVLSLVLTLGLFMAPSGKPGTPLRRKDFLFISLLLFIFGVAAKGAYLFVGKIVQPQDMALAIHFFPVAGAAGLCALIFAARRYCVVGLLVSLFACVMLKAELPLFLFFFLSSMLNTWLVLRAQSRQDVVISIIPLAIGQIVIALGSGWLEGFRGGNTFLWLTGIVGLNAFISLTILFALSPIVEMAFRYTTRFRLMELMNLEQPLLQDLMVAIPGTYHHSLVVSNMVEAGAKAVGANSLLCKVAALYHDIGKLAYPDYYIENQFHGPNRHDKLAPAMSALILLSHAKKGTELAAQNHLGDEIVDIIRQHHGTGLIKFFYAKAKELGENPRIEDYCYPGPRPQTREAAIVMLADAVEASSRTLTDPTPARIRNHIDTIMKGIFSEGQLDESELTFKDLHKLSESFGRILTGLFHQRIAYPDLNKDKKPPHEKPEGAKPAAKPEAPKAEQRPDVKRAAGYAASSLMPPAAEAAPETPPTEGAAPDRPIPAPAPGKPPIDLIYPVVPGPPCPTERGPLTMRPTEKP